MPNTAIGISMSDNPDLSTGSLVIHPECIFVYTIIRYKRSLDSRPIIARVVSLFCIATEIQIGMVTWYFEYQVYIGFAFAYTPSA